MALVGYRSNPGFAGRETERDVLASAIEGAASGLAGTVMVHGPAGIGKTSLVDSAFKDVLPDDALVLRGACLPFRSVKVPFLGLRSMFRGYLDGDARHPIAPPDFDRAPARVPLLLDRWVGDVVGERTVVIAIDDLHWADEETLDAVLYLMSGPADRRLALVGTSRTDEAEASTTLPVWTDQLRRAPRATVIELGPLDRLATADQITMLMGGAPPQTLVEEVFQRSRGHPYMTELIVAGIPPDSRHLPPGLPETVTAAVLDSVHAISTNAQHVVGVLAVAQEPMRASELQGLLSAGGDSMSHAALERLLTEGVRNGVLTDQRRGVFWFRHPLTAELVEAELSDSERRRWHRVAAQQLEARRSQQPASLKVALDAADHWHLAGASRVALQAAATAAELARVGHAYPQEFTLRRRMLDLSAWSDASTADRGRLLRDARLAAERAGALDAEAVIIEELLRDQLPDLERAGLSLRHLRIRAITQTEAIPRAACEALLQITSRDPESWQHAVALSAWAGTGLDARDVEPKFADAARRALEAARMSGSAAAISIAATVVAEVEVKAGDREQASKTLAEATEAALLAQDWVSYNSASFLEAFLDPHATARSAAAKLAERRESMVSAGAPHAFSSWPTAFEATLWLESGDWQSALSSLRFVAMSDPGPYSDASARIIAARLAALQGRPAEAQANLSRVDELVGAHPALALLPLDAVRAETYLALGDTRAAWAATRDGLSRPSLPDMGEWLVPLAARALADMAESLRDRGSDPARPLARLDGLLEQYPQVLMPETVGSTAIQSRERAFEALYRSEVARAHRSSDGYRSWLGTADACAAAELPWEEAYAAARAAECLIHRAHGMRDRGALRIMIRRGSELAARLGAAQLTATFDRLATIARISTGPTVAANEAHRTRSHAKDARLDRLTDREQEVLEHIATGHTYLQIATDLHISEKTVSAHVSHLLAKTGAANRMELARLVDAAPAGDAAAPTTTGSA